MIVWAPKRSSFDLDIVLFFKSISSWRRFCFSGLIMRFSVWFFQGANVMRRFSDNSILKKYDEFCSN